MPVELLPDSTIVDQFCMINDNIMDAKRRKLDRSSTPNVLEDKIPLFNRDIFGVIARFLDLPSILHLLQVCKKMNSTVEFLLGSDYANENFTNYDKY